MPKIVYIGILIVCVPIAIFMIASYAADTIHFYRVASGKWFIDKQRELDKQRQLKPAAPTPQPSTPERGDPPHT